MESNQCGLLNQPLTLGNVDQLIESLNSLLKVYRLTACQLGNGITTEFDETAAFLNALMIVKGLPYRIRSDELYDNFRKSHSSKAKNSFITPDLFRLFVIADNIMKQSWVRISSIIQSVDVIMPSDSTIYHPSDFFADFSGEYSIDIPKFEVVNRIQKDFTIRKMQIMLQGQFEQALSKWLEKADAMGYIGSVVGEDGISRADIGTGLILNKFIDLIGLNTKGLLNEYFNRGLKDWLKSNWEFLTTTRLTTQKIDKMEDAKLQSYIRPEDLINFVLAECKINIPNFPFSSYQDFIKYLDNNEILSIRSI